MKNFFEKFLIALIVIFGIEQNLVFSQKATINPMSVKPSTLIEEIRNIKNSNPQISAEELAKSANLIFDKKGFNYAFAFRDDICQKIDQVRKTQKDPAAPLNIRAKLNSVAGDATVITLPEAKTDQNECRRCFVQLPVWEATEKDFVTFIQNINVKFYLPPDLALNEIALVDNANLNAVVRRWKVPYRAAPLSISDDGKILYLALPEADLSDLAIMIFDEGMLQFCSRKDVDAEKKGALLKDFPRDAANPNLAFMEFKSGETKQTIRFIQACGS